MGGKVPGVTDLTGLRIGGGEAQPASLAGGGGPALSVSSASEGVAILWASNKTYPLVALPLTANGSTTTVVTYSGASVGDFVRWTQTSSMSSGAVNGGGFVSAQNQVTLVLSNTSTAALTIVPQTISVVVERYGTF